MADDFDGYRKWLGISDKKRPPTHYDLLAISLDEDDPEVIHAAADQRRRFVESKRGDGHDAVVTEILYRIDEAEATLLNNEMRRGYDRQLDLFGKRQKSRQVDPNAPRSRIQSRPGPTVGEGTDFVSTFAGIVAVLCAGFGIMAWFSFQMPWAKLEKDADAGQSKQQLVQPIPPLVEEKKAEDKFEVAADKLPAASKIAGDSNPVAVSTPELSPELGSKAVEPNSPIASQPLPKPILYVPGQTDRSSIPSRIKVVQQYGVPANGKIGGAARFDGKGVAEISVQLPVGNAPRSLAVWIRNERQTPSDELKFIIVYGDRGQAGAPFGLLEANGKWRFYDLNGGLDSGMRIDREWHHHCMTFNGATIKYYIDGMLRGSTDRNLQTTASVLSIGGDWAKGSNMIGLIDELSIFDIALTPEQVQESMTRQW